jgi:membrane protein YdbS with pleckstrin-like domain
MTDAEDDLLDRLNSQSKLTTVWQLLAALTCYFLSTINPWFWIPASCSLIGAALSAVEILWVLPRLRRRIWEDKTPD